MSGTGIAGAMHHAQAKPNTCFVCGGPCEGGSARTLPGIGVVRACSPECAADPRFNPIWADPARAATLEGMARSVVSLYRDGSSTALRVTMNAMAAALDMPPAAEPAKPPAPPAPSSPLRLTPSLRDMLERIQRSTDTPAGCLLTLAIIAAGGREPGKLRALIDAGYAEACDHPTVKRGHWPAAAARITDTGRAALLAGRR